MTHRKEAESTKTMDKASALNEMLSPVPPFSAGNNWNRVKCKRFPARMGGTIEAVMTKRVAAARNEHASRTLDRLPLAITKPAPTSGAKTASKSLLSYRASMIEVAYPFNSDRSSVWTEL